MRHACTRLRKCQPASLLGRVLSAVTLVLFLLAPGTSQAYGYPPVGRYQPSGIDLLESSLYWMQDLTGADNLRDPAAIIALMEDQAARFFDFSAIAYQVAGPRYLRMNVLDRSHFQNRLRDHLFKQLAYRMGMFNSRIPKFRPVLPQQRGGNTIVMGADFYHPDGPNFRLLFYFHLTTGGWRIYDMSSNGRSAVADLRRITRW